MLAELDESQSKKFAPLFENSDSSNSIFSSSSNQATRGYRADYSTPSRGPVRVAHVGEAPRVSAPDGSPSPVSPTTACSRGPILLPRDYI